MMKLVIYMQGNQLMTAISIERTVDLDIMQMPNLHGSQLIGVYHDFN